MKRQDLHNTSETPALEIEGLRKIYTRGGKSFTALDGVTLDVRQGEFFGLLGPNGAGKSTLISSLAGLIPTDGGTIKFLGKRPDEDRVFTKMSIGIVPQEITFDPFFTVWETLRLQSGFYGLRKNNEWLDYLLERMGLTDKKHENVSRLSGGMKRRVLIAQALVHRPPVVVLDEPTAGVDVELRRRLWDFMKELHNDGHTIILTTHYLEEAEELCSRIALLNHGRVVTLDDTKALLSRFSNDRLKFRVLSGDPSRLNMPGLVPLEDGFFSFAYGSTDEILDVLSTFKRENIAVDSIETGQANLEEVFLRLTSVQ